MEVCAGFELIAIENTTALGDDVLEIGQGLDVPVGEWLILASGSSWRVAHLGEWLIQDGPQVFCGLKLRRIPGQVTGPDAIRHDQGGCGVPAGVVEPEYDDALPSRPGLARKQRQQRGEERLGHSVRYVPEHLAGDRLHEGGHVEPLIAVVTERDGPRPPWAPRPGARSASARCGARRSPRLRLACPGAGPAPQRRPAPAFFERLPLLRRGGGRMAGAGLLHGPADRLERLPTALGQDRSEPEFARHPGRHLRAGPQATIGRRLKQTSLELLQQVGPQNGGAGAVPASQIAQSLRTLGVIAGEQTFTWGRSCQSSVMGAWSAP